jgi:uncharacterized protein (DUF4415 family)
MRNKAKKKEVVIDVTEEEYQADLAKGLREDEVLKPGRHTFKRGNFPARHGLNDATASARVKVRISINLDLDILNYFKQRAAQPNAAPYQTQINNVLREVMEHEQETASLSLSAQAEALLADQGFIEALAERIQARLPQVADPIAIQHDN